ncbi:MAG: DNA repair protein [Lachnospiraceae bacterium]|nr:DNA repair protein [Lachnospiraceae bacterium]
MSEYACIDLKSFYASVECVERGLDPLTTNLVVADPDRTDKTICLAITPAMKARGVKNRCRVFEIPGNIDYVMAVPRMQLYIDYSNRIQQIYMKYIAREDIHVYSVDEVFLDLTNYLQMYNLNAKELCIKIMDSIYEETGITATCGIGTNMYLAKIALDITAKHVADHIGILTENKYRRTLWKHKPLTDFWRIGPGTVNRLAHAGIYTMEDIAMADEDSLYRMFGVDAELLIDHAWGKESATMKDIKNYHSQSTSVSNGQVLPCDYEYEEGRLIVKEMVDNLSLELVERRAVASGMVLYLSFSRNCGYPSVRGSVPFVIPTSSTRELLDYATNLYDKIMYPEAKIRRINIEFYNLINEEMQQANLFQTPEDVERERNLQKAMISIKKKYGRNAVLKGMNLEEGGKAIERNEQIGGHRS